MNVSDWMMIAAVLVAPIAAVQVQKFLERGRESRARKVAVFQALMATRSARVSVEHVRALNMIDIEFYEHHRTLGIPHLSKRDKTVREIWKAYHDHLHTKYDKEQVQAWADKGDGLFTDLLYAISLALGYDFDKVLLKRGAYSPIAHDNEEIFQHLVKGNFLEVISGRKPLLVKPYNEAEDAREPQTAPQERSSNPA